MGVLSDLCFNVKNQLFEPISLIFINLQEFIRLSGYLQEVFHLDILQVLSDIPHLVVLDISD